MASTFTQLFEHLVPSWLSEGDGGKVLHSLAILKDALVTRARLGLNARFPRRAGPSALALIDADRGILRGKFETAAHFAERLTAWRYPRQHRVRGSAFALLELLCEYVQSADGATSARIYTLDANNNVHVRGSSLEVGAPGLVYDRDAEAYAYDWQTPMFWDALDPAVHWGRFWVVLDANPQLPWLTETEALGSATLWGGAVGTPGYAVGMNGWTPTDTANIRKLFRGSRVWRPAGVRAEWLIIQLTDWTTDPGPDPLTDGTWYTWSIANPGGTRVQSRSDDFRFVSLAPEINNVYAGVPSGWSDDTTMVDGSVYAGDPDVFNASTTLPDGSTYAGDPASFPGPIQLFDDGDQT